MKRAALRTHLREQPPWARARVGRAGCTSPEHRTRWSAAGTTPGASVAVSAASDAVSAASNAVSAASDAATRARASAATAVARWSCSPAAVARKRKVSGLEKWPASARDKEYGPPQSRCRARAWHHDEVRARAEHRLGTHPLRKHAGVHISRRHCAHVCPAGVSRSASLHGYRARSSTARAGRRAQRARLLCCKVEHLEPEGRRTRLPRPRVGPRESARAVLQWLREQALPCNGSGRRESPSIMHEHASISEAHRRRRLSEPAAHTLLF